MELLTSHFRIKIILFHLFFISVGCINITEINGPVTVLNGSLSKLVLDCNFELNEEDTNYNQSGLVVKWYLDRKPFPVYQWIPSRQPQAFGILKGRVDLGHIASSQASFRHRALAILNPTPELTGEYTCWVSTFNAEDFKRKKVTIYSSAASISVSYTQRSSESVVLDCRATGLYPEPTIEFYTNNKGIRKKVNGGVVYSLMEQDRKSYNISLVYELNDQEKSQNSLYECDVSIPHTKYIIKDEILYYPGNVAFPNPAISGSSTVLPMMALIMGQILWLITSH